MRRLFAVARYEARSHMSGKQSLRLLGVAAMLLLPAGLVPTPKLRLAEAPASVALPAGFDADTVGPPPPRKVAVRGTIPPELASRLEPGEDSPFELRGEHPVTVVAATVPEELRAALDTLDGPVALEYRSVPFRLRSPGRSLLIAILAISLLTGPLADALPGERARKTLEVLLTAGITRGELIGGKWLAWTLSACTTAAISAGLACWRGVQAPDWWLLGLPLFIGSAVAFGLWLVRLVDDLVGGSAAPMRVLPVAAGTMAAVAYVVGRVSPLAGAAVPLGGPLMVAADLLPGPAAALSALVGTVAFVGATLTVTGRDLDRVDTSSSPKRWGAMGLSAVAVLMWWLTVAGAGVWSAGPDGIANSLVQPIAHTMMVGGVALLACAAIALARETTRHAAEETALAPWKVAVPATLAVGAVLAASAGLPSLEVAAALPAVDTMLHRLREAAVPSAADGSAYSILAAAVSILGQTFLFRGVVARRLGWIGGSLCWAVAASPWSPWAALPASFALGALARRCGWTAALGAHGLWAAGASLLGTGRAEGASLGLQAMALAMALAALWLDRGEPRRHQL
jgi:ABC-type Na+ efflux pump permease subunit